MATENNVLSRWELLTGAIILATIILVVGLARNDRTASRTRISVGERQVISAKPAISSSGPADPSPFEKAAAELKEAETNAKAAQADLEKLRGEMAEQKREIEKLAEESDSKATKTMKDIQEAGNKLEIEREKLEQLGRDTEAKAKAAREDLARLETLREEQRNAAAQAGVLQGFGRGQAVDMQTQFDSRTQREPSFHAPATNPGAVEMDNRLRWTETFFEMRRINKAARAREVGPRPTMEQIAKYAKMQRPRTLNSLELDPVTGDIAWPLLLTDPIYLNYTTLLQNRFRERADNGGNIHHEGATSVRDTIDDFQSELKQNIRNYKGGEYGQARTFLDSLLQAYEQPEA